MNLIKILLLQNANPSNNLNYYNENNKILYDITVYTMNVKQIILNIR